MFKNLITFVVVFFLVLLVFLGLNFFEVFNQLTAAVSVAVILILSFLIRAQVAKNYHS